ncbi:chorismate mutase [Jiella sonneratiae]|uniref:chorismate mutase n=1 Tax=Jiella sonneratiae TaxID=2816856 RepID=A0ABS3IZB9_9HYPH|nr:chorismate mutase [Jiella sonneratiae]MBO0902776.1 chorismate mutase [Jiella sonneratiae]
MDEAAKADPSRLLELRAKIDAIDESVHRLLMQRAAVIDELIRVKGTAKNGAAFRPGREAEMMRRLAERHSGHLPLTAVEHLWREIISTFTALQAPFEVVACGEAVATVETARFYFGFSVPLSLAGSPAAVIGAIEGGRHDRLGVVPLPAASAPDDFPWWDELRTGQIVARLPFFALEGRPAATPCLVVAPPLADPVPPEIGCYAVRFSGEAPRADGDVAVLARAAAEGTTSCLVATPLSEDALRARLSSHLDIRPIGGYAAPLAPAAA